MEFSLHIVVFEIEKHSGDKICVAIHTDETLADLHVKVTNALFPVFSSTSSSKIFHNSFFLPLLNFLLFPKSTY